jgi:hypothetical protein
MVLHGVLHGVVYGVMHGVVHGVMLGVLRGVMHGTMYGPAWYKTSSIWVDLRVRAAITVQAFPNLVPWLLLPEPSCYGCHARPM